MANIKLAKRHFNVLNFLMDCKSGMTTTECQKLFGTTELRKIVSDLREAGFPITDVWENYRDVEGSLHRYKRYFYDNSNLPNS